MTRSCLTRHTRDLTVRPLPLVERADVGNHESGSEHRLLDGVPHRIPGVVEDDGHPAPGFEDAVVLFEASLHQTLIIEQPLILLRIDDRLRLGLREDAMPGFDQKFRSA